MKIFNLKTMLSVGILSVVGLAGMSQEVNAQGNSGWAKEKNRIKKEQKKELKQAKKQYRVYRNGRSYQVDQRGADLLRQAVNAGYQQGLRQGQLDRQNRRNNGYNNNSIYRNGSYGYQSYVDRQQYQYYFQQGFQRGYQDGLNTRPQYGYNSGNGGWNILGNVLSSILNLREF